MFQDPPVSSSHGAPYENPSDYASAYASDLNDFLDDQQENIQHQQAQFPSIAHAALDINPMIYGSLFHQSSSSSSGYNPVNASSVPPDDAGDTPNFPDQGPVRLRASATPYRFKATPKEETTQSTTNEEKPAKPEIKSVIPDTVRYSPKQVQLFHLRNGCRN